MKLEVGMYCYNKTNRKLGIGKIIDFQSNNNVNIRYKNSIELASIGNVIASFNIIDILEFGDYVNGFPVIHKENDILKCGLLVQFKENEIKSIVTKEQFEQMEYRLGDDK
jgi:hypothetical protein